MRSSFAYICAYCDFPFTIYRKPKRVHCPECGEHTRVRKYIGRRKRHETGVLVRFKHDELEVMQRCVKGKITVCEAARLLGRTYDSVWTKQKRMKQSMG